MKTPQTRLSHGALIEQPLPAGRSCFFGSVNFLRLFRSLALAGRCPGSSPSGLADFVFLPNTSDCWLVRLRNLSAASNMLLLRLVQPERSALSVAVV